MKKLIKRIKRWWHHKVTVLDVLEYANKHRNMGLCWNFDLACTYYGVSCADFEKKCCKFRLEEARPFGSRPHHSWWWQPGNWETGREDFLKYLINYYSNIDPIIVELL